jgi:hypothetical protein
MDNNSVTAIATLLSALTALVAVFIGPFISARLQSRQQLSAMREKWIEDLRQALSELISAAEAACSVSAQSRQVPPQLQEAYDRLVRLEARAEMMLTSSSVSHKLLQDKLRNIVALAGDAHAESAPKMIQMRLLTGDLIPLAQTVLREARKQRK